MTQPPQTWELEKTDGDQDQKQDQKQAKKHCCRPSQELAGDLTTQLAEVSTYLVFLLAVDEGTNITDTVQLGRFWVVKANYPSVRSYWMLQSCMRQQQGGTTSMQSVSKFKWSIIIASTIIYILYEQVLCWLRNYINLHGVHQRFAMKHGYARSRQITTESKLQLKKLSHDDLKCGSILHRNLKMWFSVNFANCKGHIRAVLLLPTQKMTQILNLFPWLKKIK